jgi:lysyl endopeptidase
MRLLFFALIFIFFSVNSVYGQVSQGGMPMEIPLIKSRGIPERTMPRIDNLQMQKQAIKQVSDEFNLKPFQFATGFVVNISPANAGIWTTISGYDVWQLKIRSEGAFSLSLGFDNFNLPSGARLFIFNETEGHYLGAFTSFNNKSTGKFAVSPVAGDELTIQYEIPAGRDKQDDFEITHVNHDFVGILKYSDRRPMGKTAGSCNIDINCEHNEKGQNVKDAVCRIITTKRNGNRTVSEICTGTLVNNTAENQKPYIITAAHCIEKPEFAETSVFTFNYESPYCATLDGDPGNSISGAKLLAISDSMDFALLELSLVPPPEYRPFFAGWDNGLELPDSTASIHHPQGDIKKIAYDSDPPVVSNFTSDYTPKGFLKILRWEKGVTEQGSSGGPLFDEEFRLIGSLTGGAATCQNPVNDYFSRFSIAWEFKPDSNKQLKYWLDPVNSDKQTISGKRFNVDENLCLPFTNLEDFDDHQNQVLRNGNTFAGYWGGTNSVGITEFTERFSILGNEKLQGVALGIGMVETSVGVSESEIKINVYNGEGQPETLIYSETVKIKSFVPDAMNFIGFSGEVFPADTFFLGFELSNLQPTDSFVVYQSLREPGNKNFFWFRQNGFWYDFKPSNADNYSMANVFELIACNSDALVNDTPLVRKPLEALIYPNPARSFFTFEAGQEIVPADITVYNLIGQVVNARLFNHWERKIQIDLSGNIPGVYFVRLKTPEGMVSKKVTYIPR